MSEAEKKINDLYLGRPWGALTDLERAKYLIERGVNLTSPWRVSMTDYGTDASGSRMMGNIVVRTSDGVSSNLAIRKPHFALIIRDLPRASCISLATQQAGNAACVSVNSENAVAYTDCISSVSAATARCDKQSGNFVVLRFRKE